MGNNYIDNFFQKLSIRLKSENNLSDITWSFCETSLEFRNLFLSFFFENIDISKKITIIREYSSNDSRPDFVITSEGKNYIIECKIYDRNDHFGQYEEQFKFEHYEHGFIANYMEPKHNGWIIKTWKELHESLEEKIENNGIEDSNSIELIKAYNGYLKNICNIKTIKKMKLNDLSSLVDFNYLVSEIIESPFNELQCLINNNTNGNSDNCSGKYFSVWKNGLRCHTSDLWFGIIYNKNDIAVWLGNDCDLFNNIASKNNISKCDESEVFFKKEIEGGSLHYYLRKEKFKEFNEDETNVKRQKEIVTKFFQQVIDSIIIQQQ